MNYLLPVAIGLVAGIALIALFAIALTKPAAIPVSEHDSKPVANASSQYESDIKHLAITSKANCFDLICAAQIIPNCDVSKTALIESGNYRAWIISALKDGEYCRAGFTDYSVLSLHTRFPDFIGYGCSLDANDLESLKGSSFNETLSHINSDWGSAKCGEVAP